MFGIQTAAASVSISLLIANKKCLVNYDFLTRHFERERGPSNKSRIRGTNQNGDSETEIQRVFNEMLSNPGQTYNLLCQVLVTLQKSAASGRVPGYQTLYAMHCILHCALYRDSPTESLD